MVWRAAAAIELGICDAVLCALPARYITPIVQEEAQADGRRDVLRFVEQPIRLSASGIRDPVRQSRPERARTARWPNAMRRSTATTSGRWPRSSSTSGSTPTTPKVRSGKTSRSPSRTCWPARSSPTRCTCWRSSCPASVAPPSSSPTPTSPDAPGHRPVWIKGFGEHVPFKTPTYAEDLLHTPIVGGRRNRLRA